MGQVFGLVGVKAVKQSNVAVREHCGKFDGVLQPGCHCVPWCFGYKVAGQVSLRVQQLIWKCDALTKDNRSVKMYTYVHFRPSPEQVDDAFYKGLQLQNLCHQMTPYVNKSFTASVAKLDSHAMFEGKNGIAKAVQEDLQKAMSAYGYEIIDVITYCDFHSMYQSVKENSAAKEMLGTAHQPKQCC